LTKLVGFESAPKKDMDWLHIPEQHLFELMHRPIFYDGPGDVTAAFEAFAQYPEIRKLKTVTEVVSPPTRPTWMWALSND